MNRFFVIEQVQDRTYYAGLSNHTSAILHEGEQKIYQPNTPFVVQRLTGTGRLDSVWSRNGYLPGGLFVYVFSSLFCVWCSLRNVFGNGLKTVDRVRCEMEGRGNKECSHENNEWKEEKRHAYSGILLFRTMSAPTFIVQRKIGSHPHFLHSLRPLFAVEVDTHLRGVSPTHDKHAKTGNDKYYLTALEGL